MTAIVRIDDEMIGVDEFVRVLKLTGQFEGLVEQLVRDKLTAHAARRHGVKLTPDEVQERADQFRRVHGLHRAADMNHYLDALNITLDEFESFITDSLYQEKMMEQVCTDQAVESYFQLNSPKFDSIEVSHIVVDTEGKAKELVSYLQDDPDAFSEMAREHSIADTREQGGDIGKVLRGSLKGDIEARVFNAEAGDLLGPFPAPDKSFFEVFLVRAKHPARLDPDVTVEIRRLLREEWLMARAQEHVIEAR
ncbi:MULTISPECIES: peptidylprolyl isomerase [unclassified Cupriavidus]|uniref:peptidylprolyl isomerase n=1 Tax=unclassified Cupriavidus TaxID=2640874 RepID=UPI001C0065FD|nr:MULTISPECIES: peptidylprolyl isomerase [unclassified Cupriavidus]MCA3192657.1 peptidylprolyl isomerase [Cupriavidus sp.]MCA3194858.1 peptidylprolyl isomerase [Cupriavidus sp.]MCA3200496.1 peptidylprolyl isomerase [Cupriavidus sp.]MCA3210103.1 peptidylprolyl isomerase [Cupriavidus sp.]MCA3233690.1 peptidylprolyl isomerase [Cupriavidus sp.]